MLQKIISFSFLCLLISPINVWCLSYYWQYKNSCLIFSKLIWVFLSMIWVRLGIFLCKNSLSAGGLVVLEMISLGGLSCWSFGMMMVSKRSLTMDFCDSNIVSISSTTIQESPDRYAYLRFSILLNRGYPATSTSSPYFSFYFSSESDFPIPIPSHFILAKWLTSLHTFFPWRTSYFVVVKIRERGL